MPIPIPANDLDFLLRVRDLGRAGKSAAEIAEAEGMSRVGLLNKLARMGFRLSPVSDVRTTLTGDLLSEMLERGELVAAEDRQPVEVA